MNRATLTAILMAGVTLAACDRPHSNPATVVAAALQHVLVVPGSAFSSMSAGDSAGQLTLTNPLSPDSVALWYREELPMNHWDVKSDITQADGTISMYTERTKQPLWITIRPTVGARGSTYTLVGVIMGSADSTVQRSGSSKSSNRIQRR